VDEVLFRDRARALHVQGPVLVSQLQETNKTISMRCHLTPLRMAIIKKYQKLANADEYIKKREVLL
jgi:hypothetical protein